MAVIEMNGGDFIRAAGVLSREDRAMTRRLALLMAARARKTVANLVRSTPVSPPTPDHTGPHARDQWQVTSAGPLEWGISNSAEYLPFLLTGTSSHFVAPVNARALRFYDGGSVVFSAGHEVSGILPNGALLEALESAQRDAAADLFLFGMQESERLAAQIGSRL